MSKVVVKTFHKFEQNTIFLEFYKILTCTFVLLFINFHSSFCILFRCPKCKKASNKFEWSLILKKVKIQYKLLPWMSAQKYIKKNVKWQKDKREKKPKMHTRFHCVETFFGSRITGYSLDASKKSLHIFLALGFVLVKIGSRACISDTTIRKTLVCLVTLDPICN